MKPDTFRASDPRKPFILGVAGLVWILVTLAGLFYVALLEYMEARPDDLTDTFGIAPLVLCLIAWTAVAVGILKYHRYTDPDRNFLHIDEKGVNYVRGGKSRQWVWNELSTIEYDNVTRRIRITVSSQSDSGSERVPLVEEINYEPPVVCIDGIWEPPLVMISAKLNDCRNAVLGIG